MAVQSGPKKTSRSGNPKVRASARPTRPVPQQPLNDTDITSPSAWVSHEGDAEVVTLPSGNKAKVRRTGPEAFLQQGLIPDSLTPIVEKSIHEKKGLRPEKKAELLNDPKALGSLVEMLDRSLCYAVIEPRVLMPPVCTTCSRLDIQSVTAHKDSARDDFHEFSEGPRDPNVLYADRVDFDDKMFIMNFCVGGTRDLEQFRRETRASMASVSALPVVPQQAE